MVRPAGRTYLEVKVLYTPDRGKCYPDAKVNIVRYWLKEAAGKALARRTEIAYEAVMLDEKSIIFKV